jgi:prevent-host-death family protein
MRTTNIRRLREELSSIMERAAGGEEIIVTRRGRPYVRMLPATHRDTEQPLRGSVVEMADDFDAPMTEPWNALKT